jgi:hypothetical protein
MMRVLEAVVLTLLMLTGCLRGNRANELAALLKVAPELLQSAPPGTDLPSDKWPQELRSFDPSRVYSTKDGLFIVTSSFFVHEKGLFLSRSQTFAPTLGGDPEFRQIVPGLFSYELKG